MSTFSISRLSLPSWTFTGAGIFPSAAPLSQPTLALHDTSGWIRHLKGLGFSEEAIAGCVNGTAHTAYLKDIRLAWKVVSVAQDETAAWRSPEIPEERRRRVFAVIRNFLVSGEDVSEGFLKSLLEAVGTESSRSLKRSWDSGAFGVRLVDDRTLEVHAGCKVRHARELSGFMTMKDREHPLLLLKSPTIPFQWGRIQITQFRALLGLLFTLIHEWDHWRQFSQSVRPSVWNHDEEIAELLSHLEEHRLRVQIGDREISRLASEQGLTVTQFLLAKVREAAPSRFERFVRLVGFR